MKFKQSRHKQPHSLFGYLTGCAAGGAGAGFWACFLPAEVRAEVAVGYGENGVSKKHQLDLD